ncbi:glycosyltransferase [Candidatus Bipolaricaulota bacterium]|nr:glycosyltransferase [Candidatus Bipolaricaulota bacterium]
MPPRVTVVVPALDEERWLPATLQTIRAQRFQDYELLVVDNGSRDRTPELARNWADRVLSEPQRGAVHAMHRGFLEARGELVVTADADTLYPPTWLGKMVKALDRPHTVAAYGPMGFRESHPMARALQAAGYCLLAWGSLLFRVPLCGAANLGIRKEAYFRVGGYPPLAQLASPDFRLSQRLRRLGKVRFVPTMVCWTSGRRFHKGGLKSWLRALEWWWDVASGRDRIPAVDYWTDGRG